MKNIIHSVIIAALIALMAACSGNPTPATDTAAGEAETPALNDDADSLGYYLGLSLAETLREKIGSDSTIQSAQFDPALFSCGIRDVLAVPPHHPGFRYGADHGASIQNQVLIFRSVGLAVSPELITAGFSKGMATDTADTAPVAVLDRLMGPVNNLIIQKKMREHLK